jgi:flagellar basal-body rod protein FlgG
MKTQNAQLDAIANNVANASTPGFKRSSIRFGDLVSTTPTGVEGHAAAMGVAASPAQRTFAAGELRKVDDVWSVAIQGAGFLETQMPDGSAAFVRGGRLSITTERLLATADGLPLRPQIHVPVDMRSLSIGEDGQVHGLDDAGRQTSLGRLDIAVFANPGALTSIGDGLWKATNGAGDALMVSAGEAGAGRIKQSYQEASNVQLVDEMVQLMIAQRAYEMNVKVMQAADEVASMANNLRK